ncbi:6-phosphogluconolactonase [Robiginitalea sp. M366]|uniref:6-phosphogluconolactonase n=1 Tax=Robiginitalea aestuariiviva TaxID=3036903 RepID=UPI00240CEFD9|nr:6-phosphogluconolactonase [Robiginitalea aestuariiviva]MDG1573486.1 6-phosphogluconolactonase [Robiginitalea aestuariiviva]
MEVQILPTKQAVAEALSEYLVAWCQSREAYHLALSGGSTPKIWFDHMAAHFREQLPWDALHWYWGDERCVPPDHPESNYGMTARHLLEPLGIAPDRVHRVHGEARPDDEAPRYAGVLEALLPQAHEMPQFDLVILGMGDDGHTASVFPHQMGLWDAPEGCVVATHPESGQKRISLTGPWINNARRVVFLVTGASKAEMVREVLEGPEAAKHYPAARVSPTDGKLLWLLDAEAAAGLSAEFIASCGGIGPVLPGK